MKENRLKQCLAKNEIPIGHMIMEFNTRGMASIMEAAEVDFVVIDMEHSGFTSGDIADQMAWFNATSVAPFVRIPQVEYHFIARALDAGALGIMVPNVKNGHEAKSIVDSAKYAPLGKRGVILGGANTGFQSVDAREFMDFANENTTIICQIESRAGLENLEEIASTTGVDVLWVGQFDLSQSMGIPGQFNQPEFLEALGLVVETAREHGVAAGIQPGNLNQAQEWMEIGFNVISFGTDMRVYLSALSKAVNQVREFVRD